MTTTRLPVPVEPFTWEQMPWGPVLRCRALEHGPSHFFTARPMSFRGHAADTEWSQVAAAIGVPEPRLLRARQVHGTDVALASMELATCRPEVDALVTNDPALALVVQVADCVPVLLSDPVSGAVAAVHAGWRGTRQGVVAAAVQALTERFSAQPRHLIAAIGPSIGPCCYEVGDAVLDAFRASDHPADAVSAWFVPGTNGRVHLDLWRANRDQLLRAGVPAAHVHSSGLCTKDHPALFHSYRAEGPKAGRLLAVIRPGVR